jgi:phage-related protein
MLIVTYWDQIKSATLSAWGWVVDQVSGAKDGILAAVGWLAAVPGMVGGWFGDMKDRAVQKSLDLVTWLTGLPGRIGSSIGGMVGVLRGVATRGFQSFRDASAQKVSSFITWVQGVPGRISRGFGSLTGLLVGKGKDVVRGLWNGIKSMGAWLRDTLIGWAKSIIPGPIAKALGIASPSRVMRDQIGRWIPAGIVEGIESGSGAVDTTMRNLVSVPTTGQATAAHVAAQTSGAVSGGATSGDVVRIGSDGSAFGDFIVGTLRQAVGTRGGNVQFAITGRA